MVAGPDHRLSLPKVLGDEGIDREEKDEVRERAVARPARVEERRRVDERKMAETDRRLRMRFKEMKARREDETMMRVRRKLPLLPSSSFPPPPSPLPLPR